MLGFICPSWVGFSHDSSSPTVFRSVWGKSSLRYGRLCPLSTLINSSSHSLSFRIFQRRFRPWCLCFPYSKGYSRVLQELFHPSLLCSPSSTGAAGPPDLAWSRDKKKPPSNSHKEGREHTGPSDEPLWRNLDSPASSNKLQLEVGDGTRP